MSSLAADELWAGAGAYYKCFADSLLRKAKGNCNLPKVHSDKSETDIDSRISSYLFNDYGAVSLSVCRSCKGAACLGLGNNVHPVSEGHGLFFNNDSSVKMLTALSRNIDTEGRKNAFQSAIKGICCLGNTCSTYL